MSLVVADAVRGSSRALLRVHSFPVSYHYHEYEPLKMKVVLKPFSLAVRKLQDMKQ